MSSNNSNGGRGGPWGRGPNWVPTWMGTVEKCVSVLLVIVVMCLCIGMVAVSFAFGVHQHFYSL